MRRRARKWLMLLAMLVCGQLASSAVSSAQTPTPPATEFGIASSVVPSTGRPITGSSTAFETSVALFSE